MDRAREKTLKSLRELQGERRRTLRGLTGAGVLALGTVAVVERKCGNQRCHCVGGPGHLQTLFLFKDERTGRRRCKLVRREDEKWMMQAGLRYRSFRKQMKRLCALNFEEKRTLRVLARLRAIRYE